MLKNKFRELVIRDMPEKFIKYKENPNHLTNVKKTKLYEYYICDNCGCEIEIKNKWEKSKGGVILLPYILTHKADIKIAICNKCFKEVLKEFEGVEDK